MGKGLSLIVCCFMLSGCATAQRSGDPDIQSMQSRIDLLEDEVKAKDQEIESMQNELRQVKQKNVSKQDYSRIPVKKASATVADSDDLKEIIRVNGLTAEKVQFALKNAGLYDGKIDGKIGPKTKEAIKAFQRDNDLKADGIVGRGTWAKLKKNI